MSIPPGASAWSILSFLFRTDQGVIDRAMWWRSAIFLMGCLAMLTGIWMEVGKYAYEAQPAAERTALFDPAIFGAYAYLTFYGLCVMLIGVSFYNLSAKRCRARGRPPALAGLVPLFALLSGAAHWLYPRVTESMPYWTVVLTDVCLIAAILWSIVDLGLLGDAQ